MCAVHTFVASGLTPFPSNLGPCKNRDVFNVPPVLGTSATPLVPAQSTPFILTTYVFHLCPPKETTIEITAWVHHNLAYVLLKYAKSCSILQSCRRSLHVKIWYHCSTIQKCSFFRPPVRRFVDLNDISFVFVSKKLISFKLLVAFPKCASSHSDAAHARCPMLSVLIMAGAHIPLHAIQKAAMSTMWTVLCTSMPASMGSKYPCTASSLQPWSKMPHWSSTSTIPSQYSLQPSIVRNVISKAFGWKAPTFEMLGLLPFPVQVVLFLSSFLQKVRHQYSYAKSNCWTPHVSHPFTSFHERQWYRLCFLDPFFLCKNRCTSSRLTNQCRCSLCCVQSFSTMSSPATLTCLVSIVAWFSFSAVPSVAPCNTKSFAWLFFTIVFTSCGHTTFMSTIKPYSKRKSMPTWEANSKNSPSQLLAHAPVSNQRFPKPVFSKLSPCLHPIVPSTLPLPKSVAMHARSASISRSDI